MYEYCTGGHVKNIDNIDMTRTFPGVTFIIKTL